MVKVFKKHSSAVFSNESCDQAVSAPTPQRELKKRKSVRFDQPLQYKNASSTCDFVSEEKQEWDYIANCFDLADEPWNDHLGEESNELVDLCNYFETQEKPLRLTDDSEDHLPYEIFAEQGMRISYRPPVKLLPGSTVSTLRLSSMLRIGSSLSSDVRCSDKQSEGLPEELSKEDMEKAFQGVLPCSNSQQSNQKRQSAGAAQKAETTVQEQSEDFWSNVEF